MQCVAVCGSVLQCVAVWCSGVQCVVARCHGNCATCDTPGYSHASRTQGTHFSEVSSLLKVLSKMARQLTFEKSYTVYRCHACSCYYRVPRYNQLRKVLSEVHTPNIMHMCAMTHSHVLHDSCTCVTWLIHIRSTTQDLERGTHAQHHAYVCHDSFTCMTWLMHMCDMTHSYTINYPRSWAKYAHPTSFICVPWPIHMCAMTHSYVCHDSFICEPWLLHTYEMSRSYVRHDTMRYHQLHTIWSEMRVIMYVISLFLSLIVTYDPFSLSHCHIWLFLSLSLSHMTLSPSLSVTYDSFSYTSSQSVRRSRQFRGVWRNVLTCVTWLISHDSYHMTHITWLISHDMSFIHVTWLVLSLSLQYLSLFHIQHRGRCGEYSMVFYHLLAALGYETRWIVDWTDHNWVEVRVKDSWIHLDPSVAVWMGHVIYIPYEWFISHTLRPHMECVKNEKQVLHFECVKNPTWSGFIWTRALWYEWVTSHQ